MKETIATRQLRYSKKIKTISLSAGSEEEKRKALYDYFNDTFSLYETLFSTIREEEALYITADPLRHPLIFYYGHTAVFFINKLLLMKLIEQRINPTYESLFAIGVDEMSWDDLNNQTMAWPSLSEVTAYREQVRSLVSALISSIPLKLPITWEDPAWIILMGIEHERIHLETSSVLIRQLPIEYVTLTPEWMPCQQSGAAPINTLIAITGRQITLGKPQEDDTYGWDNEYGQYTTTVADFKASQYLVSNREFLSFIEAGGYQNETYWTDEGWRWLQYTKSCMPRFWRKKQRDYFLRLMNTEIAMPWDWPVEVNYLESKAFCQWLSEKTQKKIRLPTEAEWYVLAHSVTERYPHWRQPVGNIDLGYYASPCPVNLFKQGKLYDIIGNVWQWTETTMHSFPGFRTHQAYDDFSVPTFDGQHNLIKGGSFISTGNEALLSSRYAFRRHFYQHAGFRYVESETELAQQHSHYETDKLLAEYLEFHFGDSYFTVPIFAKKIADIALSYCDKTNTQLALDLGCATGRTAFELSKQFTIVYGIDFSTRFIQAAETIKQQGTLPYAITIEGDICDSKECSLEKIGISMQDAKKITFLQGDACNLKPQFTQFNLIIAANLIDRLYDPLSFLENIHERLVLNGILLISSPYTWLLDYTKKDKWLGGIKINGENMTTLSRMTTILQTHFTLLDTPIDVPFVIRETARKYQHSIAQVTVWKRIK